MKLREQEIGERPTVPCPHGCRALRKVRLEEVDDGSKVLFLNVTEFTPVD